MYYSVIRRGGTTTNLWTPSELSSLRAWYDVSAETGYADGDTITSLTDQSGNGITVTGTGTYNTSVQNGLPVVTQSADFVSSSVSDFDGHTRAIFIMVVKNPSDRAVSIRDSLVDSRLQIGLNGSGLYWVFLEMDDGNLIANTGVSAPAGFHMAAALSDNYTGFSNRCPPVARIDGTQYTGNFNSSNGFASRGHTVGMVNSTAGQQVCEVVLVSDAASFEWTDDEPEKLEGYLAHKWGLTANLPTAHPYKTLAPTV